MPIAIRPSAASARSGMPRGWRKWAITGRRETPRSAPTREIEFLRDNPPKSLAETLSPAQVSGDSWQNYASRWALCHFLVQPQLLAAVPPAGPGNSGGQGRQLRADLRGDDPAIVVRVSVLPAAHRPGLPRGPVCLGLEQEVRRPAARPHADRHHAAGRGWQPTGLTGQPGHAVRICRHGQLADRGRAQGRRCRWRRPGPRPAGGRLDERLPTRPRVRLGGQGSLQSTAGGDLYLRCRNAWNELADDSGHVAVKFKLQGQDAARRADSRADLPFGLRAEMRLLSCCTSAAFAGAMRRCGSNSASG